MFPRGESFEQRPESGIFEKLQEIGVFLLLGLISFKIHTNGFSVLGSEMAMCSTPKDLGLNAGFLDYLRTIHGLDFLAIFG